MYTLLSIIVIQKIDFIDIGVAFNVGKISKQKS